MERKQTIYLVDDDQEILELLSEYLERQGFAVSCAENGAALMQMLRQSVPDCIVLDIMLPGEGGLAVCRNIRAEWQVPIIFLSALNESTDRIVGLELGADDYISKPFEPRELLARIRSVLRRNHADSGANQEKGSLYFAGWRLDRAARCLESPGGVMVNLSGAEYRLLMTFLASPQRILSRDTLLELTQGRSAGAFDRSIDVQVSRLRMRLRDEDSPVTQFIKTVRGDGYIWTVAVRQEKA